MPGLELKNDGGVFMPGRVKNQIYCVVTAKRCLGWVLDRPYVCLRALDATTPRSLPGSLTWISKILLSHLSLYCESIKINRINRLLE